MKALLLPCLALLVAGCTATHERPMGGEKTMVSDKVLAMVDENDGRLDIRDHENVRCKRIKLTGSHMVTRLCYTNEEDEEMDHRSSDKMRDRFGKIKCLDSGSQSCNAGLGERGIPGG